MSDISYSKFLIKSKFNPKKAKKYIESYPSKEKERTSELIIYSDGISGKYL